MTASSSILPVGMPATDGAAAFAAVEIVAAVVVMGVLAIQHERAEHKEKEHIKQIEAVIGIHNNTLKTLNLEPFFSRLNDTAPYTSSYLSIEFLKKLAGVSPLFNGKTDRPVRHVLNAIAYLVEYHIARISKSSRLNPSTPDDVTSSVISGLIVILGRECVKFTDNLKVLDILAQVDEFINLFSSQIEYDSFRKNSLTQAIKELKQAHYILKSHNLSLSITELVLQTLTVTDDASVRTLTSAVNLAVKNEDRKYTETFIPQRLKEGYLRYEIDYQYKFLGKILNAVEQAVVLPKTILSDWIKLSSADYLLALSLDDSPDEKGNFINLSKFQIPNLAAIHKALLEHWKESKSFLTLKAKPNDKRTASSKLVSIDINDLPEREAFFLNLIILMLLLNILRYHQAHFRNSILKYGERRYETHPHDMVFMFGVLREFRTYLGSKNQALSLEMERIISTQNGAMLTPQIGGDIKNTLDKLFIYIDGRVCTSLDAQWEWHNANMQHHHPGSDVTNLPVHIHIGDDMLMISHRIATALNFNISTNVRLAAPPAPPPVPDLSKNHLNFANINIRITELAQKNEITADEQQRYTNMYTALTLLFAHSLKMGQEVDEQRLAKAHHLQILLLTCTTDFSRLLKKNATERQASIAGFANSVELMASNPANKFIDERKAWTICFWKTASRQLVDKIVIESERMANLRP